MRQTDRLRLRQNCPSRLTALFILASCIAAFCAPSAGAATVTVGPTLSSSTPFEGLLSCLPACTETIDSAATGVSYRSPVDGAIVRWRIEGRTKPNADGGEAAYRLRILTPSAGAGTNPFEDRVFTGAGSSETETLGGRGLSTFPASLQIKAGQLIGIDLLNNYSQIAFDKDSTAHSLVWFPPIKDGETRSAAVPASANADEGQVLAFNADVQPLPSVSDLSPSSGSIEGGFPVALTGADFTGTTAVTFGDVPASFTVNSETEIVATAPPFSTPSEVGITVETAAGLSSWTTATQFAYIACTVPDLKRRGLKSAKGRLRHEHCRPGHVKKLPGAKARNGRVVRQYPQPGAVLPPGTAVRITLKKRR